MASVAQCPDRRVALLLAMTSFVQDGPDGGQRQLAHATDPGSCCYGRTSKGDESSHHGLIELVAAADRASASGEPEVGIELYQQWLRHHPDDPLAYVALFNQAALLRRTAQTERAVMVYAAAIQLAPTFLPAFISMGFALESLGRLEEAIGRWVQVADCLVQVNAESLDHKATALRNISRVCMNQGDLPRAEEALRRCLEIDPHQGDVVTVWIDVREKQCRWPVIAPFGKLTRSSLMAALSPLTLAIHTNDPIYQLANAWRSFQQASARGHAPYAVGHWVPPEAVSVARRRLRIGYVSPDLRDHAIGSLTAELFELHDRTRVEVFAYYSGIEGLDMFQARIRNSVDHWAAVAGWDDKRLARQIVSDEIDILIDLAGHCAPNSVFALRPAPVIVNWLGYPGSMGTPYHQYIIADDTIIPPSHEKYYSERVVRLPCYQPTDRKRLVANPPSRRDAGLREDAFVYCCLNGTKKITPQMFRCWMAILGRVPNAVLWLLSCDTATDERLRQQAVHHGITPERLVFAPLAPHAEHLARYALADLFLDTWPYGAHTTASDALWMGLPVLTLIGHSFASRVCASLVRAAGQNELVCSDPQTYEDCAVELGTHADKLTALRDRLRANRDQSTLFDMPLLVTRLEALFEQMWSDYLAGRVPEPDLENLAVYSEIGDELDHESADILDLQEYEQAYARAVAYRDSISRVPPDCRLWGGRSP